MNPAPNKKYLKVLKYIPLGSVSNKRYVSVGDGRILFVLLSSQDSTERVA